MTGLWDPQEPKVLKVLKGPKVLKDHKEFKEQQVLLDLPVKLEVLAQQDPQDLKDLKDLKVDLVFEDQTENPDQLVPKDNKDQLDTL